MSKEEMAKTPCIYHAQGKCRRGDKCFYKHDKAAAATKDTKRANSPAPKKKSKDSTAAPCLIQKFACIVRKQPKATSCSDESSVSMKRLRFRKVPHVIEVKAVGRQVPVRESSLRCTRQLKMFQFHPRLNNMRLRFVQDSFKKLWNFMIQMLHLVVGFVVGMRTHVTSRAKSADSSAVPKLLETLVVSRQLPRPRQRPASVGLSTQVVNPILCPRVCWGMLAPRTAVQPSIRFP